jgi:MFS family permease
MNTLREVARLPRPLRVVYAGTTVNRLGAFVFPYLTIYLAEVRGYSLAAVGQVLAVGALGLFAGNLAGGWLTDRWSRKRTLMLALVLNAVGYLGLSRELGAGWQVALMLALGYFGTGLYQPAANTIIADLTTERERPLAYTVHYVCINVGMALGPLIGGLLFGLGYRLVFLGDVASTLACAALIGVGISETRPVQAASETAPIKEADAPVAPKLATGAATRAGAPRQGPLPRPGFVLAFSLASFFLIAPLMGLEYSVPLLVKRTFGADLYWVGAIYSINAVSILALSFLVERHLRGKSPLAMMALAGVLWTAGVGLFALGFSLVALVACTFVWSLGEMIASIVAPTYIARSVRPEVKGRYLSLLDAMRGLASVLCPLALGFLWTARGVEPVVGSILALPLIGTLAYLVLLVRARPQLTSEPTTALSLDR